MGSGSQLIAPQAHTAKAANIEPDLKNTEICLWSGAGLPGETVLPALPGRAGPRKGHSASVWVLEIAFGTGRVASLLGRGFPQLLEDQSWPRRGAARGAGALWRPAPPGSAARRLSPTPGPVQAAGALILTRSAVSVRSGFSSPWQQQHMPALRFDLQGLCLFYPNYHRLLRFSRQCLHGPGV